MEYSQNATLIFISAYSSYVFCGKITIPLSTRLYQQRYLFWLRGWDLNHTVLPFSLRRKRLRSPRGENSPPDCFLTPLGRSLSVAASDLFALRSHNPSVALFKISLVAKNTDSKNAVCIFLCNNSFVNTINYRKQKWCNCFLSVKVFSIESFSSSGEYIFAHLFHLSIYHYFTISSRKFTNYKAAPFLMRLS